MRFFSILVLLVFLVPVQVISDSRVRKITVQGDQVVTVKTAIGIATIIQVPDSPNSVVVGNQNAFKVEYLERAITIKPLSFGAKSNLYIYTDWKRYNVQLVAGPEATAEYIVYLENPKRKVERGKAAGVVWTSFKNQLRNDGLTFEVNRLGRTKDGVLLIEFTLRSKKKETLRPEWLWLTQNGQTRLIHSLFLSSLQIKSNDPVQGVIQLLQTDLELSLPLRVELRRTKTSYLTVREIALWK